MTATAASRNGRVRVLDVDDEPALTDGRAGLPVQLIAQEFDLLSLMMGGPAEDGR